MSPEEIAKNLTELQSSIFEAKAAYTGWKAIAYSRSTAVVGEVLAEKYVEAQKTAPSFFSTAERAFLVTFVTIVLHPLDRDTRSFSFFHVDSQKTEAFITANKEVVDSLYSVRNKIFAHKENLDESTLKSFVIPSVDKMDIFFDNLIKFYNELTVQHINSSTIFDNAGDQLVHEMDYLFMNLSRGETMRLKEINMEWQWEKDPKKISNVFDSNFGKKN